MRASVTLDDDLLKTAHEYTGMTERAELLREALKSIIARGVDQVDLDAAQSIFKNDRVAHGVGQFVADDPGTLRSDPAKIEVQPQGVEAADHVRKLDVKGPVDEPNIHTEFGYVEVFQNHAFGAVLAPKNDTNCSTSTSGSKQ